MPPPCTPTSLPYGLLPSSSLTTTAGYATPQQSAVCGACHVTFSPPHLTNSTPPTTTPAAIHYNPYRLIPSLHRSFYFDEKKGYNAQVTWYQKCPLGYTRSHWFNGVCTMPLSSGSGGPTFYDEVCVEDGECRGNRFLEGRGGMWCVEGRCRLREERVRYNSDSGGRSTREHCWCKAGVNDTTVRSCVDYSCYGWVCDLNTHTEDSYQCRFPRNEQVDAAVMFPAEDGCSNCEFADGPCCLYEAGSFNMGGDLEIDRAGIAYAALVCFVGVLVVPLSMWGVRLRKRWGRGSIDGSEGGSGIRGSGRRSFAFDAECGEVVEMEEVGTAQTVRNPIVEGMEAASDENVERVESSCAN